MKELSIKEKAKAYDKAIERAKQHCADYVVETIFPELAESEDERIRKSLIKSFKNQHSYNFPTVEGFSREQILAWLEKQGEQKPTEWSEEDENTLNGIIEDLNSLKQSNPSDISKGVYQEEIDWLKSLKERVQPQSTWKPSDEQMDLLREVQQALLGKDCHNRFVNFMYELKRLREE